MSDRPDNAPLDVSDALSVVSSNHGDKAPRQAYSNILIAAFLEDDSEEEYLSGLLDTGSQRDLISEHVVKHRWGPKRIDTIKTCRIYDLGMNGISTLGQMRIIVRLGQGVKLMEIPFHVGPVAVVRHRFDILLSDRIIDRRGILILNPLYVAQKAVETDSEDDE